MINSDGRNSATSNEEQSQWPNGRLQLIPWIESAALLPKEIATNVWATVHSEDFSATLSKARESIRWPFAINLQLNNNSETASYSSPADLLSTTGTRIVVGKGAAAGQYDSLAAAIREAKSGDIIELRNEVPLLEEPLDITNLKLTIRGAAAARR